ncbi:S66 peptidase family protein [Mariniluteicoccus flavus]
MSASPLGPLSPGARVAVVGTSGPPTRQLHRRALELLSSWGFDAVAYASSRAEHPRADYLTGPDSLRAKDFEDAWCDPEVDGVVAIRGGYGSVRMLDLLDADRMRAARPKPFFGSSDTTGLQEWLREVLGAPSWFTPMPGVGSHLHDHVAMEGLRQVMVEPWQGRRITAEDAEVLVPGTASGTTIGGNLSLLQMTLGARTRRPVDNTDTIALLEDVNEDAYKVDGFLTSLLRAGWFDGVRGIALGSWLGCVDEEVRELCVELLAPLGVPMVWELGFGHCLGATSVPLGVRARLEATGEPGLVLEG